MASGMLEVQSRLRRWFEKIWEQWRELGQEERVKEQHDQFRLRMYDLSEFLKTFKQRFSIFYIQ